MGVGADRTVFTYVVEGDVPRIPPATAPTRADELWKTTCFELFVNSQGGEGYFEFNFSPSTQWAAYSFTGYRDGMADLPIASPLIEPVEDGTRAWVDLSGLPRGPWRASLSAVIEETDGTKSYWALAHPAEKPDFHHPDCFVLELPAPHAT
jgi:hypothetical protein